jgi:hypothetical protein
VHATGKFQEPETMVANSIVVVDCDSVPPDTLVTPEPNCTGGALRGTVLEVREDRNIPSVRIMTTWFSVYPSTFTRLPQVGERIEALVDRPDEWLVAYRIGPWYEAHDEIEGVVHRVETSPDGTLRLFVLGTWIAAVSAGIGSP